MAGQVFNLDRDAIGILLHLHFGAWFRGEGRPPVGGDSRKPTRFPPGTHRSKVVGAKIGPIATQTIGAQLVQDKAESRVDGKVEVRCAHGLGVGVRQRTGVLGHGV